MKTKIKAVLTLHDKWVQIAKRSWAVRFAVLGVVLSGVELGMSVLAGKPPIEPTTFAIIYGLVSALGAGARLIQQAGIDMGTHDDDETEEATS